MHRMRMVVVLCVGLVVPAMLMVAVPAATPAAGVTADPATAAPGVTRLYYIAADTVRWNFVPTGRNQITGAPFDAIAQIYTTNQHGQIGPTYFMSQYRQYTDATFTHLVARPAADAYEGILGPVIHAEVGDTIKVVFKNNTPYPASMHPHGVFYTKSSEGAPYNDGTSGADKSDDAVKTGHLHTYVWQVPDRAGPGPMDPSSVVWMYHSHSDEVADTNSGLVGAIVVSRRGSAKPDGSPVDIDQEVFVDFQIFNENLSLYSGQNIATFLKHREVQEDDEAFEESNLKHSINGFLFGNMPLITLKAGSHVRWYLLDLGTETDLHTPHWHGNTVLMNGMTRTDMVQLLPGAMLSADMVPDDPGTWLFHCHVNDHILAGMQERYRVVS